MSDTLDILTPAEAQASIGALDKSPDASLAIYITSTSRIIDNLCGPVVVRTVTNERHDIGCSGVLSLNLAPVQSVTTVIEYQSDDAATTLTADTATVNQQNGYLFNAVGQFPRTIYRRSAGVAYRFPYAGHVVVTYVAGRYATTAAVDARFKVAATIIFANLWRFARGTGNQTFGAPEGLPGFGVPNAAMAVLQGDLLPPAVA